MQSPSLRKWYLVARAGALGAPVAFGVIGVGLVVLVLTWYKASATTYVPEQLAYLGSGGLIGLALVIVGTGLVVSSTARDDSDQVKQVLTRLTAAVERFESKASAYADGVALVWRVGETAHVPGCLEVGSPADAELVMLQASETAGLEACTVCRPFRSTEAVADARRS